MTSARICGQDVLQELRRHMLCFVYLIILDMALVGYAVLSVQESRVIMPTKCG
jgi:hypothetical protein